MAATNSGHPLVSDSGDSSAAAELSNNPGSTTVQLSRRKCRFFGTTQGCKAGEACLFSHNVTQTSGPSVASHQPRRSNKQHHNASSATPATDSGTAQVSSLAKASSNPHVSNPDRTEVRGYNANPPTAPRLVQRPVPKKQVEDPRAFQISQIQRRYQPTSSEMADGTALALKMTPSDPDFPFDIAALVCTLSVPSDFPTSKPSLRVTNKEMGRGYQINVERGFDAIVQRLAGGTLLQYLNALDKELEVMLAAPKAETVKLVANVGPKAPQVGKSSIASVAPRPKSPVPVPLAAKVAEPTYTNEEKVQAKSKRGTDVQQLEARLGRLPQFLKSHDGLAFTLPIEPRKRSALPVSIQAVKAVKLIVPELYNIQPCTIQLQGVSGNDAATLEEAFRIRATAAPNLSLVAHINYLSQNMHTMATNAAKPVVEKSPDIIPLVSIEPQPSASSKDTDAIGDDRKHIITIPRPPEWSTVVEDGHYDSDDSYSHSSADESDEDDAEETEPSFADTPPSGPERGILLSLPFLELHGIELIELVSLSLTIKCTRCKTTLDVSNIRNNDKENNSRVRSESCRKCANSMDIGYRMDMMHANSVRCGYLDLDGCTVVDILPSIFIPTCSECSTAYPSPGITSVRGESSVPVNCRECHSRMSFRIPEVKFLQVSATAVRASRAPSRKKKEPLGITAGQELPRRGRCSHYSKSYRWFRFSCCEKVFACDRCHDEAVDHPNEHANRMICGFCSREQNYRPEDCGVCHSVLIGKKGHGFWEGGKGTRDKTRMSRKDPRKYKRNPGSKSKPLDRSSKEKKKFA